MRCKTVRMLSFGYRSNLVPSPCKNTMDMPSTAWMHVTTINGIAVSSLAVGL